MIAMCTTGTESAWRHAVFSFQHRRQLQLDALSTLLPANSEISNILFVHTSNTLTSLTLFGRGNKREQKTLYMYMYVCGGFVNVKFSRLFLIKVV